VGAVLAACTVGQVITPPLAGVDPARFDLASAPVVELYGGELSGVDADTFERTPPALLMGAEVVGFRDCTALGDNRYQLGTLLRGLRGTDYALGSHQVGERALLLDSALIAIATPAADFGARVYWRAATLGRSAVPDSESAVAVALGLVPLAPCHLDAVDLGGGDWSVTWVRRTRRGGAWRDGVEASLGEASERYRAEVWRAGALISSADVSTPAATVAALAGDLVRVAQLSEAVGAGHAAELTLG
jgi:hypothetical protein